MKRLLNTLYVITQGTYLSREGETVLVRVDGETKLKVPIHTLSGIVCFGQVSCSPPLMELCGERNVLISFLSEHGRFWARVQGPVHGNVLLRREQYRRADDNASAIALARTFIMAKIANCRMVLLRAVRDHNEKIDTMPLEKSALRLAQLIKKTENSAEFDNLRGHEGEAAQIYFGVFNHLIVAQKNDFLFNERNKRPPLDPMNALLSFLYSMLANDVTSALESVGLDPAVGFLHCDRPGRPGLALDLMEELRPVLADRTALTLVNLQQISVKGFRKTESGAVIMDEDTRKSVLVAYQKRKGDEIQHPFLKESIFLGLLPFAQALLLARCLRGDLDCYPPYFWR